MQLSSANQRLGFHFTCNCVQKEGCFVQECNAELRSEIALSSRFKPNGFIRTRFGDKFERDTYAHEQFHVFNIQVMVEARICGLCSGEFKTKAECQQSCEKIKAKVQAIHGELTKIEVRHSGPFWPTDYNDNPRRPYDWGKYPLKPVGSVFPPASND